MQLEYEAVLIMQHSSSLASPFGRLNFNYCVALQKDISFEQHKIRAPMVLPKPLLHSVYIIRWYTNSGIGMGDIR